MSFLSRLLGTAPDPREAIRPLWHRVVELAREPSYYADCNVADSVGGRFDLITAVVCVIMVRLEASDMRAEREGAKAPGRFSAERADRSVMG